MALSLFIPEQFNVLRTDFHIPLPLEFQPLHPDPSANATEEPNQIIWGWNSLHNRLWEGIYSQLPLEFFYGEGERDCVLELET